jgi:Tfp pilus assembly protein PilO
MSTSIPSFNYKTESNRYKYYYRRLATFYEKPIIQVSTAVLFTLATITFFALFAIKPTLQTITELLKKIDDQKKVLSLAQKKAASLSTAQKQYELIENDIDAINMSIPQGYNVQELIKEIEAIATQYDIPLNNVHVDNLSYPLNAESDVKELGFTVSFNATYPTIKQVIIALEHAPRMMRVDGVTITAPDEKNKSAVQLGLQANLTCKAFYIPAKGSSE